MASETPVISVEALHFAYGGRGVVHDVSLQVAHGEVIGLLGPNGSGKSTIIKIVGGLLAGYRGSVRLDGRALQQVARKALARTVAMVPQESVFSFPFSVLEVVAMGRYPHLDSFAFESREDIAIAQQALQRCGAAGLATRNIHELSAGERQRVVFARALAQQPRVLLLDEPASFLDIRHQVELYDIVRDLAREQQCGVLTVLHDLNLAAEYCDRIYLLAGGTIQAGGNTADVLTYSNVKRVFETEVYVDTNSLTGKPLIIPLSRETFARLQE